MAQSANSASSGGRTRTIVLGAIAAVLLVAVAFQEYGQAFLPGFEGATPDTADRERLVTRIERLSRFVNAADQIEQRYSDNAFTYAQQVANVRSLMTDPGDTPKQLARRSVQGVVEKAAVSNSQVQVGAPNRRGAGVHEVLVSISFSTPSNQHATRVVRTLGDPGGGSVWRSLSISADRDAETVTVSGDLKVLVLESAE